MPTPAASARVRRQRQADREDHPVEFRHRRRQPERGEGLSQYRFAARDGFDVRTLAFDESGVRQEEQGAMRLDRAGDVDRFVRTIGKSA